MKIEGKINFSCEKMLSNIPYLLGMLFLLFIPFGRHCLAGEDATVPNTEELAFEPIPDAETKMDLVAVSGAIKRVDHSQLWGIKPLTPIEQTLTESEVALFRRLWVMVALMEKPIALKQHDLVLFARALNILVEMEPAKRSVNIKMARFMQWLREEQCTMDVSTATQMDEIEGESPLQNDKNAHVDLHILSKILGLQPTDHVMEGVGSHGMNNGKILVFNMQPKNNGNEVAEKANMADPSKVDKEGNEMAQQNISEPVPEPFIEVPHNVVASAPLEQMPANYPMGMAQPAPMRSTSDDAIVAADSAESNGGGGLLGFLSKLFLLKRRKRQIPLSALEQAFGGDGAQIHIVGEQEDPLALLAERIQKAQEQKAAEQKQQTAATNAQMAKLLEQIIEKSFASKFNVPSSQDGKDDENSKTVESEQCDKNAAPRNPLKEIVVPKAKKSADIVMMDEKQAEMDSKNIIEMLTKALNAHKMSGKIVDENRKGSEGIVEKTHSEPFLASSQTAMAPQIQTADDENSGNPAKENSAENQAENAENPKCQKLNAIRDYLLEFVHQTKGDIGKTKIDERLAYIWLSELQYWLARHAQREFNAPNVSVQQLLGNEVKALDFLQRFANIWHTKLQFALPKRVREEFDAATQGVNPVMEKAGKRLDFLREQWEQTDKQLTELKEWIGKDYKK